MKEIIHSINAKVFCEDELTAADKLLITKAKEATYKSYAPYSHFYVGASIMLDDKNIITGNNQENCAYPSGICAERTAVFYANSQFPENDIDTICIAARNEEGNFTQRPISPCGACRQVLLESEKRQKGKIRIILYGTDSIFIIESVSDLLPIQFDQSYLS